MKKWIWILAMAALSGVASFSQLSAQNITGTWQGAIKPPQGRGRELRIVLKISTTDADKLTAVMYSIDQQSPAIPATTFTRNGSTVKMTIAAVNGTYEGRLSGDGNSIEGTWTQGVAPAPEPGACHPRDRVDHSGTPASAEADGCRREIRGSKSPPSSPPDRTGVFPLR